MMGTLASTMATVSSSECDSDSRPDKSPMDVSFLSPTGTAAAEMADETGSRSSSSAVDEMASATVSVGGTSTLHSDAADTVESTDAASNKPVTASDDFVSLGASKSESDLAALNQASIQEAVEEERIDAQNELGRSAAEASLAGPSTRESTTTNILLLQSDANPELVSKLSLSNRATDRSVPEKARNVSHDEIGPRKKAGPPKIGSIVVATASPVADGALETPHSSPESTPKQAVQEDGNDERMCLLTIESPDDSSASSALMMCSKAVQAMEDERNDVQNKVGQSKGAPVRQVTIESDATVGSSSSSAASDVVLFSPNRTGSNRASGRAWNEESIVSHGDGIGRKKGAPVHQVTVERAASTLETNDGTAEDAPDSILLATALTDANNQASKQARENGRADIVDKSSTECKVAVGTLIPKREVSAQTSAQVLGPPPRKVAAAPDQWRLRTVLVRRGEKLGLWLLDRDTVVHVQMGSQAEALGIQLESILVSFNHRPFTPDALKMHGSSTNMTIPLVLWEPKALPFAVEPTPSGAWRATTEMVVKNTCYREAEAFCKLCCISSDWRVWTLLAEHLWLSLVRDATHNYDGQAEARPHIYMRGPQRWCITRRRLVECLANVRRQRVPPLQWRSDEERKRDLFGKYRDMILHTLHTSYEDVGLSQDGVLLGPHNSTPSWLQKDVEHVWETFWNEHGLHHEWFRLTPAYIRHVALVPPSEHAKRPLTAPKDEETAFYSVMNEVRYSLMPLVSSERWEEVKRSAWERYKSVHYVRGFDITPKRLIVLFNDWEQEDGFLTTRNFNKAPAVVSREYREREDEGWDRSQLPSETQAAAHSSVNHGSESANGKLLADKSGAQQIRLNLTGVIHGDHPSGEDCTVRNPAAISIVTSAPTSLDIKALPDARKERLDEVKIAGGQTARLSEIRGRRSKFESSTEEPILSTTRMPGASVPGTGKDGNRHLLTAVKPHTIAPLPKAAVCANVSMREMGSNHENAQTVIPEERATFSAQGASVDGSCSSQTPVPEELGAGSEEQCKRAVSKPRNMLRLNNVWVNNELVRNNDDSFRHGSESETSCDQGCDLTSQTPISVFRLNRVWVNNESICSSDDSFCIGRESEPSPDRGGDLSVELPISSACTDSFGALQKKPRARHPPSRFIESDLFQGAKKRGRVNGLGTLTNQRISTSDKNILEQTSAKKTPPQTSWVNTDTGSDEPKPRQFKKPKHSREAADDVVRVGTQVYCRHTNGQYYEGVVFARSRSRPFIYSIEYFDGEKLECVSRSDFFTRGQMDRDGGIEGDEVVDVGTHVYCRFTNGQWYWGLVSCRRQEGWPLQFVYSIDFHDGDKLAGVPRSEFITEERYHVLGLTDNPPPKLKEIKQRTSSGRRKRKHVPTSSSRMERKRVKNGNGESVDDVGVEKGRAGTESREKHLSNEEEVGYNLRELYRCRCGVCGFCLRPECGSCAPCIRNKSASSTRRECCYRKMCLKVDENLKAQACPGFPPRWRFVFTEEDNPPGKPENTGAEPRLCILGPHGERYQSVKDACSHHEELLAEYERLEESLVDQIGVPGSIQIATSGKRIGLRQRKQMTCYSLSELKEHGCMECSMCIRRDCGRCIVCVGNTNLPGQSEEICLRKMCSRIPLEMKAQPGYGMPGEWRFAFCEGKEKNIACRLVLLSPGGKKFYSLERAQNVCASFDVDAREFYKTIGAQNMMGESDHVLIGKNFYQQWVDMHGCIKEIYGMVALFDPEAEDKELTVTFSNASRSIANSGGNDCGCKVPESARMGFEQALGGCMMYDRVKGKTSLPAELRSRHPWKWIVPDVRLESLEADSDGTRLPHLMVTLQGFKLDFTVAKSTIDNENAGYGVFMSCETLDNSAEETELVLEPGILVDLAVYSPLRASDRKPSITFLLKNFVHSLKCQAYAFETGDPDYQFDITDDVTGNMHAIARERVPPYVNECSSEDETPTINALHDPEGSVHYLLGHKSKSDGRLVIPANGKKTEVFVDYGPDYEDVRVRASYSRLTGAELTRRQRCLEKEDLEYIHAIDELSLQDVDDSVKYFFGVFSEECRNRDPIFLRRSILAVVLLLKRVSKKYFDVQVGILDSEDSGATQKEIHQVLVNARRLVSLLLNRVADAGSPYHELFLRNDLRALEERIVKELGLGGGLKLG